MKQVFLDIDRVISDMINDHHQGRNYSGAASASSIFCEQQMMMLVVTNSRSKEMTTRVLTGDERNESEQVQYA